MRLGLWSGHDMAWIGWPGELDLLEKEGFEQSLEENKGFSQVSK